MVKTINDPRQSKTSSRSFIFYDWGPRDKAALWFTNPDATEFMKQHSKAISIVKNVIEVGGIDGGVKHVTGKLQLKASTRKWSMKGGRCVAYNVAAISATQPTHRCRHKIDISKMRVKRLLEPGSSGAKLDSVTVSPICYRPTSP